MEFLKKHKYELALALAIIVYVIYFTIASFARYDNFYTGRFDLGNMAQTVWNTAHGNIFELTDPNGTRQMSRLSVHADFILVFLAPLYLIWANPKMLLLVQSIVLGLGAIFAYKITKEILKDKTISLIVAISYLLNPGVGYTNLYEFHAVTLATTFLLASFYFLLKKQYLITALFLILAGLTKEQVWLINAFIGLFIFVRTRQRILGATIFISGILLFYYLVWVAIPHALGGQHFALSYYSDFGATPTSVIKNILFEPVKTFQAALGTHQLDYLRELFIPYGYLSFFSPLTLIPTAPSLAISLLSNNPQLYQIYYQYSSTVTPFVILSLILGIKNIRRFIPEIPLKFFSVLIVFYTLIAAYSYGPLIFAKNPNDDMFDSPLRNKVQVETFLSKIPENYSISSTNNLGSHLSQRQKIYTVPLGIGDANIVAFLKETNKPDFDKQTVQIINAMNNNRMYKKTVDDGNFIVFEKIN